MQTKLQSIKETVTHVGLGYFFALATQFVVFPLYGMEVTFFEQLQIGWIFTVVALIRVYIVRRYYNWKHRKEAKSEEWPSSGRIDVIGQNGNEGSHYE